MSENIPRLKSTPIPIRKIGILGLILTANNMSIWMIFSFLPFMVSDFFPELSKSELGYKAGILGSAFSVGGLFGNLFWGTLSDKCGRRPALLAGLFGTALSSLCFGFAPTFWFAVLARFLWGLLNGNIGVAKTYLAEISDDSNSAKGMALFGVIGGVGRTIGPIIGGFLSSPAKMYPGVFNHTIFAIFPYALPSLIVCVNCLLVLAVAYFELDETLPAQLSRPENCSDSSGIASSRSSDVCTTASAEYSRLSTCEEVDKDLRLDSAAAAADIEIGCTSAQYAQSNPLHAGNGLELVRLMASSSEKFGDENEKKRRSRPQLSFSGVVEMRTIGSSARAFSPLKHVAVDEVPLLTKHVPQCNSLDNHGVNDGGNIEGGAGAAAATLRYSNGSEFNESRLNSMRSVWGNMRYLLTRREVFLTTLLYGLNAFTLIVLTEIFPLWVVTAEGVGGFGYDAGAIGMSTMVCGVVAIFAQVVVYPALVDRYGVLRVYRLGTALFGTGCVVMPMVSMTTALGSAALTWVAVVFMSAMLNIASSWVLICVFVLINNSSYSHQRATVNGIGQTFASLGRICGPYLGAVAFAWSETNKRSWPLNFYFVWYMLSLFAALNFSLVFLLPRTIERRRREPKYAAFSGDVALDSRMARLALEAGREDSEVVKSSSSVIPCQQTTGSAANKSEEALQSFVSSSPTDVSSLLLLDDEVGHCREEDV